MRQNFPVALMHKFVQKCGYVCVFGVCGVEKGGSRFTSMFVQVCLSIHKYTYMYTYSCMCSYIHGHIGSEFQTFFGFNNPSLVIYLIRHPWHR
jgi:hypothetical protein